MRQVTSQLVGAVLAACTISTAAMAQNPYYDDLACQQHADQQIAPLRGEPEAEAVGSTLLGAGLGAALGGALGGGRGAGIGAASGAIVGGSAGAANAQNTNAYLAQQYNNFYAGCMAARRPAPPPAYAPAPAYMPGSPGGGTQDLNRQELNRLQNPYR